MTPEERKSFEEYYFGGDILRKVEGYEIVAQVIEKQLEEYLPEGEGFGLLSKKGGSVLPVKRNDVVWGDVVLRKKITIDKRDPGVEGDEYSVQTFGNGISDEIKMLLLKKVDPNSTKEESLVVEESVSEVIN